MAWTNSWDDVPNVTPVPKPTEEQINIVKQAKKHFTYGQDWEAVARTNFEFDYKFANGDTHNKYQWDNSLVISRELLDKPCLTINKTQQHNLMIINDAKQNKPGVRIRPVGDEASYEGAQIYQELIYHIEYISNAENVYDSATMWQVEAGIGYWRVATDYISDKSFDQEIYIRRIKDPRSVYLDPDINEVDGSDARWGQIFEDIEINLFKEKNPKWASIGTSSVLGNSADAWITKNHIRVCEYFCKEEKQDKLVTWTWANGQVLKKVTDLEDMEEYFYKELKKNKPLQEAHDFQERKIVTNDINWYKIAGDRVIDEGKWLGKYIPIVRLVGTETVIDGILDRKGHTRALINAQQMYNYNTSANVEYGALQTKAPWIAASAAIEGYEEYYKTANRVNHSYIPYNAIDDDGNVIPPPSRPAAPQASPAYVEQMKIAQNEMMMASGQYQSQFGENENAKSGVAINARQRQGDRATYHFIDNQAIAIRFTGKILIDLIPKIYDTPRIKKILAQDGSRINVKIDVDAQQGYQDVSNADKPLMDNGQKVKEVIFNPDFGMYDIQADTGPSFATKRMETTQVLTTLFAADKDLTKIGGDILFKNMDFAGADTLALRFHKMLPPNISGDGPDPATEETMQRASQMIEMLQGQVAQLSQKLEDKDRELTEKGKRLDLDHRKTITQEAREDYKAETQRAKDLFNTGTDGSGVAPEFRQVVEELVRGMLKNGELNYKDSDAVDDDEPPVEGAKKAPDGMWYAPNEQGNGFNRVDVQ